MQYRELIFSPLFARLFIPFGIGYFLSILLGGANATMAPILVSEFNLTAGDLGFMSSIYLIAFGAAQFPLGVYLDIRGARKTLAPLLLIAVAGAIVFAYAHGSAALMLSRALIGVGLSGSLMAAFKGYSQWLPSEDLPAVYSVQSFMGGLGGMCATRPMSIAFGFFGWRSVFVGLSAVLFVSAAVVWFVVPKDPPVTENKKSAFFPLLVQMLSYLGDRRFWIAAPVVTAGQSVMFAFLYLWISPWMHDVAGFAPREAELFMMLAFFGTALGYLLNGILAGMFKKRGWLSWEQLYLLSGILLTVLLCAIAAINGPAAAPVWPFVMFLCNMTMISFPIVRTMYSEEEVGRVLSLLNFVIFLFSFFAQWFLGMLLDMWPQSETGFAAAGYQVGIFAMVIVNAAAVLWYYICIRNEKEALDVSAL